MEANYPNSMVKFSNLKVGTIGSTYPGGVYTDKKENKIFLIYKEILNGAVPKSYMTNGLLKYD